MSKSAAYCTGFSGSWRVPDAYKYGDEGSNTLKHIAENTDLNLPNLASLGLGILKIRV